MSEIMSDREDKKKSQKIWIDDVRSSYSILQSTSLKNKKGRKEGRKEGRTNK